MKKLLFQRKRLIVFATLILTAIALRVYSPPLKKGLTFSQVVRARDGKILRVTLSQDEKYRIWTPLQEISPALIEATLFGEDKYFRQHWGFNPVALVRAAYSTYVSQQRRVGGSTLTMQLARVRYGIRSRSVFGKVKQLLTALHLEWCYSKDEILEAYLNLVPYGLNIEGVGAASIIYFQKVPQKLSLAEAITLAVIPQNPTKRSPKFSPNQKEVARFDERVLQARAVLLDRWKAAHPQDHELLSEFTLPMVAHLPSELPFLAPHAVDEVLARFPAKHEITTTLDLSAQRLLESLVKSYIETRRKIGISNAAVLLLDHKTMQIEAVVGSADFFDAKIEGQVNGTSAMRSPGSTMKPFLYGLALEQGLIHPKSMLKDTPTSFGIQNPENSDREFLGPVSAEEALNRSRNLPAMNLAAKLRSPNLYEFFQQAELPLSHDADYYGLALVLGGAELTMEQLVRLYAMLPNQGIYRRIKQTTDDEDRSVPKQLLSPEAAYVVQDMLSRNLRPNEGLKSDYSREPLSVSWKTGTSNSYRDAWSVAIFGQYVMAVWVGSFDGTENPAYVGRDAAAPLLFNIVDALRSEGKVKSVLQIPPALQKVSVCAVSGQLPGVHCKTKVSTLFIPGRSPIQTCEIHREVMVQASNGLRACSDTAMNLKAEVFEFWPSDLLSLFRKAGIPRRVPPPFDPSCPLEKRANRGLGPEITSPVKFLSYQVRTKGAEHNDVPLEATADTDVKKLFWFVNEAFLGETPVTEAMFWKPRAGKYIVRVVDDQGRSANRAVTVTTVE